MFEAWKTRRTKAATPDAGMTAQQLIDFLGIGGVSAQKLSEATYFACLKVLGESLGKLPLKLLRVTPQNGVSKAVTHPLYNTLKYRPNPYMTASVFWSTVEYNRNHFGNAYCLITGAGRSLKLWILPSESVKVWWDDRLLLSETPNLWYIYTHATSGKRYKFSNEEILHFKTSTMLDGISGLAVQEILKTTINGNMRAQNMLNKLYENGFVAKAVVQYTGNLSDPLVSDFVKGIERFATGEDAQVKSIIPIPLGSTLTPLNIKLTDAQFIELKKYSALQIAAAFGIKPNQINDYEKSSYASAEAQQLAFYVDTLLYILKQYEEEISYKLLSARERENGLHFKFNVAVILRADSKTQIESLSQAVQNAIYTPNEARALIDMERKEGGDELIINGNAIPIKMAGQQYRSEPKPQQGEQSEEPKGVETEPSATTTSETEPQGEPIESVSLNGTQISSLIEIVQLVASGAISFDSALVILTSVFPFDDTTARQILNDGEQITPEQEVVNGQQDV